MTCPLKLILTAGSLIGLGIAFAPEAGGTFVGAVSLGVVVGAAAFRRRAGL